jgi:RNA polymerase sigma factor (sigma-70 family)
MAASSMAEFIQHLRGAMAAQDRAGLTDGQLLEQFLNRRDEVALTALVRRHGPMVWGVCRRVLGHHHDAEDAFQATFLVLLRKAATIVPREMVANWLYGVARQTALRAGATASRRKGRERLVADIPEPAVLSEDPDGALNGLVDEELGRLPDKYRAVIVLCDLQGRTRQEAARQLRCPPGTVAGRLARARGMLAKRLARHGLAVPGAALAGWLSQEAARACVPTSLVGSVIQAAGVTAGGQVATGPASVRVAELTEGVLRTMRLTRLSVVLVLVPLAALGGMAGLSYQTWGRGAEHVESGPPSTARKDRPVKSDEERLQGIWKIVSTVDDGSQRKPQEQAVDLWVIKDRTILVKARSKDATRFQGCARFRLDPMATPRRIDLTEPRVEEDLLDLQALDKHLEDPDHRAEGVYSIDGDTLTICVARKKRERPSTFESRKGSDRVLWIFKREKPAEGKTR